MVRIRAGTAWRHDPALRAAARHRVGPERTAAAREVVGALALEVDGVDIAAGLAEGPLLPSLEALLRAVARVVRGEPQATVPFADGAVELLVRRRGPRRHGLALRRARGAPPRRRGEGGAAAARRRPRAPPGGGRAAGAALGPDAGAGPSRPGAARRAGVVRGRARGRGRPPRRVRGR